jgi:hypothetical protein
MSRPLEPRRVVREPRALHPRPLLERPRWRSLDGEWQFAFDHEGEWLHPEKVPFDGVIQVPFPPESSASGIGATGFHHVVWYRKLVRLDAEERAERLLLHFGAIDYHARIWVNGQLIAEHFGGHTPICCDISEAVEHGERCEIVVRAADDPHDLTKPRGKQDWLERPHEIWYPRTTGIWQSVWLEPVPETHIGHLRFTPHLEQWEIAFEAELCGPLRPNLALRVLVSKGDEILADDRYALGRRDLARRIAFPDPGIDDHRNHLLWTPAHPVLLDVEIELWEGNRLVDQVFSYTALRSVGVTGNRFMLNGRPYYLRMVLDQGYWPSTLLAPPSTDALRLDVELARALGFNAIRKHQKIEDPRWLYWCDRLGMLVWEEMPSPYRFTAGAVDRLVREWTEVIRRDASHPCIVAWVPLNESWGVPDLTSNPAHRDYVRALYHLTKTLDPHRPVIGNDGWEHVATDIITIHDYAGKPEVILERYGTPESTADVLGRQQPGGRALLVHGFVPDQHPVVLSEFGGIAELARNESGWGYSLVENEGELLRRYTDLLRAVHSCRGLAGFCYTQLTDTFQERNGLCSPDRVPKVDAERIALATRGRRNPSAMDVHLEVE